MQLPETRARHPGIVIPRTGNHLAQRGKNELPYNGRSAPLNIPGMEPGSCSLANRNAHAGFRSDDYGCDPAVSRCANYDCLIHLSGNPPCCFRTLTPGYGEPCRIQPQLELDACRPGSFRFRHSLNGINGQRKTRTTLKPSGF